MNELISAHEGRLTSKSKQMEHKKKKIYQTANIS